MVIIDYTYLKNDGTILSKKLLINSNESDSKSNINVKSISLNRVIESLKQYNNSIIYVNDIINEILSNVEEIKKYGFQKVLSNYSSNQYIGNYSFFYVNTIASYVEETPEDALKKCSLLSTYNLYPDYIGLPTSVIIDNNNSGNYFYFPNEGNTILNYNLIPDYNTFGQLYNTNNLQKYNYYLNLKEWDNGMKVDFKCILYEKDIISNPSEGINPDYIVIGSGVPLNKIIEDVDNIQNFSPEYVDFSKKMIGGYTTLFY